MDGIDQPRKRFMAGAILLAAAALLILGIILQSLLIQSGQAAPLPPKQVVEQAWQRARELGSYRFTTNLEAAISPPGQSVPENSARYERLYLEGQVDLPAQMMELTIWEKGGQVLNTRQGIQVRVAEGKTYGRVGSGDWQEMEGATDAFAPGQDPMAFLAGAKELYLAGTGVVDVPAPEGSTQVVYTRYRFTVDGLEFARNLRAQLEQQMAKSGDLPPGVTLDLADAYRGLSGTGEIWVDDAGLPLRLLVDLVYPEQYGEQSHTQIKTDFFDFSDENAAAQSIFSRPMAWIQRMLRLPVTATGWSGFRVQAISLVICLALVLIMVGRSRSRAIYNTCAVVIILSMLVSPIWQSQKVLAYTERIEAKTQKALERANAARMAQEQKTAQTTSTWDSLQDPLAASAALAAVSGQEITAQPLLTVGGVQAIGVGDATSPDPNSDVDLDGLTYQEELRLGTDPTLLNSDLDDLSDGLEVGGFKYLGVHYYTNPLETDTAHDGLPDTMECWSTPPSTLPSTTTGCSRDSDSDGQLDIFERDNDGDNVADSVDLSPFSVKKGFSGDDPFLLLVNKLEPLPVIVDLQIRPTNPEHLAYTLSVLDWPTGDTQGQVQRVLDNTFATAVDNPMTAEEIETDPRSQYGDMRLIPMLETRVPYKEGHTRNLPVKPGFVGPIQQTTPLEDWVDQEKLDMYGMVAQYLDDTGTLGIYIPLNLVPDETGGSDVAFQAHYYYEPQVGSDWGNAHELRVVWWVQVLTDQCDDSAYDEETATEELEEWCARPKNRIETAQVVQTYPESWDLTGLSVREDHGLEAAVAFEDPDTDIDKNDDDRLWKLADGLDNAFLTSRDQEPNDGIRDITTKEIEKRWNNLTNPSNGISDGDAKLWQIKKNELQVSYEDLPHVDYMVTLVTTTTMQILENKFLTPSGCQTGCTVKATAPTILTATEAQARTANLDAGGTIMGWGGKQLTVSMDPSTVTLDTVATVSWVPYRYGVEGWEPYPLDEYMLIFGTRMQNYFPKDPSDPEDVENFERDMVNAAGYYLALTQGSSATVESGGEPLESEFPMDDTDITFENGVEAVYRATEYIAGMFEAFSAEGVFRARIGLQDVIDEGIKNAYQYIYEGKRTGFRDVDDINVGGLKSSLPERICAGVKLTALITMAVVAVVFAGLAWVTDSDVLSYIQAGVMATGGAILFVLSGKDLLRIMGSGFSSKISSLWHEFKFSKGFWLAIAAAVIDIAAQIALFVVTIYKEDIDVKSWEFGAMLAQLITSIIVTALLFAIYLIPVVGEVIYAIVTVINAVLEIICMALGLEEEEEEEEEPPEIDVSIICSGISGMLSEIIFRLIYSLEPISDPDYEDGLTQSAPDLTLDNPEDGFVVNSKLSYTFDVSRTIRLTSEDQLDNWKSQQWSGQFNETNLKKSAFEYMLTPGEADAHDDLYLGKITNWQSLGWYGDVPYVRIYRPLATQQHIPLTAAGINQSVYTYYNEGFDLPLQECWGFPPISGCGISSSADTGHAEIGQYFQYDVFPATLDAFRSEQAVSGGYRLSWGGSAMAFPVLKDADGDGIMAGADPGDGSWDFDSDGLSDPFEQEMGTNPKSQDSDSDTLLDRDELLKGSDPNSPDSDNDGLSDKLELTGWDFVYGWVTVSVPKIIHVTSDPRMPDSDFDGLIDQKEWLYGWNPQAVSEGEVLTFSSELKEKDSLGQFAATDGVVRRNDILRFEANVKNELDLRYARGLLSAQFPTGSLSGSVDPRTFVLAPREPAAIQGDLTVSASSSGPLTLTQTAGAELYDAQAASNYAELLLHMEEAANATVFLDESGGVERHNGTCAGSGCPVRQAPGMSGKGVRFTSDTQVIDVDEVDISRGSLGVTMWISTTASSSLFSGNLYPFTGNGNSAQLSLSAGKPCLEVATTPATPKICGTTAINNGDWHHLAFNYDETTAPDVMALYVDGVLVVQQTATARKTYTYDVSGLGIGMGYLGDVDEVAVYSRVLTPAEIDTEVTAPLSLHAPLDEPAGATTFVDVNQGNNGDCSLFPPCPTMGGRGISRTSAKFNGQEHIDFDFSSSLANGFTVSAWIQPVNTGTTSVDDHWQGVIGGQGSWCGMKGWNEHYCAFPSIERKGDCIRSEFGDMSNVYQLGPVCGLAPINTWSHVSVAFNQATVSDPGYYTLYVNGEKKGETILQPKGSMYTPYGGLLFTAGCSWLDWNGTTPNLCFTDPAQYTNPFHGSIDEIRVHKLGLTAEQIKDLYTGDSMPLYLHLDDPPGSYLYPEANQQEPASCPSNLLGCPTSGVSGRMNQAALFTSAEGDGLSTQVGLDLGYTSSGATIMGWVYPTSGGARFQMVMGTEDANSMSKEWRIWREPNGYWGVENGSYEWVSTLPVELNRWQHIAVVFNPGSGSGSTKIFKNCGAGGSASHADLGYPNHSNSVFVGCDINDADCFQGRLDEVKVYSRPLADSEIQAACAFVPQLSLHMEDAYGATTFKDDSHSGKDAVCADSASSATCPKAALDGQVGLAVEFDGLDDGLYTTFDLVNVQGTIMVWAYPNSSTDMTQALVASYGNNKIELYREGGYWKLRMGSGAILAPSTAKVRPDEWQHLAIVITQVGAGTKGMLYLNGSALTGETPVGNYSLIQASVGYNPTLNDHHFDGRIDEMATYGRALAPAEIKAIYDYQAGWVEQVQHTDLTVDNDLPTTRITMANTIIGVEPIQLRIETTDATTAVRSADWRVNSGAWTSAPPCQGADGGGAWCPTFTTNGSGSYTVDARSTDSAGNISSTASVTLRVDNVAPTATLAQEGALVQLQPAPSEPNGWVAVLSGTVSDATPSSGVAAVRVALIDPRGVPMASGSQAATNSSGVWNINYLLTDPLISGPYTVLLEADDSVGNHSANRQHSILLDRTAPQTIFDGPPPGGSLAYWRLDEAASATQFKDISGLGNDAVCDLSCPVSGGTGKYGTGIQLSGGQSIKTNAALPSNESGLALSAWFQTGAASPGTLFAVTDSTGVKVATVKLDAGGRVQYSLTPSGTITATLISTNKTYNNNAWHHLSAQWQPGQVQLLLDGQLVRTIDGVNGSLPASLNVVVGRDGGTDPFNGKVDDVSIQGVHLTPSEVRSLAYTNPSLKQNQVTLQGMISELETVPDVMLSLTLDEKTGPFIDSSDYDNDAACSGTDCPTEDAGPYGGGQRFNGSNSGLYIKSTSLNYLANALTLTAWVKPERLTGIQRVVSLKRCSTGGGLGFGLAGSGLQFTTYGVQDYYSSGITLTANAWQHIAAVMHSDNSVTFYVNGYEQQTITGSGPAATCLGDIQIARAITSTGAAQELFQGSLDEVQVYNRALTSGEILAMGQIKNAGIASLEVAYASDLAGSTRYNSQILAETQLVMPFDDTEDDAGNVTFLDISGTGHSGTCIQPNCPTAGQIGHNGSAAMFEGTDILTIAKRPTDLANDYYTIAAWIYPIGDPIGSDTFISRSDWAVTRYSDGSIRWVIRSSSAGNVWINTGIKPQVGKWTHIAVVFDAGVVKTYANGALRHTYPTPPTRLTGNVANASTLNIGGWPAYSHYYTGGVDDVNLISRALTAAEVEALYLGSEPVVHLPFDENWMVNSSIVADTSGWDHNGILASAAGDTVNKAASGQVGLGALSFDGVDDFLPVAVDVSESSYGLSLWFKTACSGCGIYSVVNGPHGWDNDRHVYLSSGNVCARVYSDETICTSGTNYADGQWHHLVHTFGGNEGGQKLYMDGLFKSSGVITTSDFDWETGIEIGYSTDAALDYFSGQLDDLRIYPRALPVDEVQALYDARWQAVTLFSNGSSVMRSGWNLMLPSGLEGHYRVDMRSLDTHGNDAARSSAWDGVLDTTMPRAKLTYEGGPTTYTLRFSAQDWNLDDTKLQMACPTSTIVNKTYFNPPWYRALTGVTMVNSSRLYSLDGSCQVTLVDPTQVSLTACDLYSNCTVVNASAATTMAATLKPVQPTGQVLIQTPAPGAVVNSQQPVVITGKALADTYLKRLTVTVDGKKVLSQKWDKRSVQSYDWSASWAPATAGEHVVEAALTDWMNAEVKHTVRFILDTTPPNLIIATQVLTTTHVIISQLPIQGTATDENGIALVEVQVKAQGYTSDWTPATLEGDAWQVQVYPGHDFQPDDEVLSVQVRATDRSGMTRTVSGNIIADLQPPAPSDLAISYDDLGAAHPITRTGTILTGNAPNLNLRWSLSSDGAGLAGYQAGWTIRDSSGVVDMTADFSPTDELLASYQAGEAQQLMAGVASIDQFGNKQSQGFGPIYVDSPLTPDYIGLDEVGEIYHGWMESGCSLLGQDRRVNQMQPDTATRGRNQALYATWDAQALRLAWTGANWSGDGDLFVYLDSIAGGTLDALNPFTTTATLQMPGMLPVGPRPGAMHADYVVWVQDHQTAWLYRWDGSAWAAASQLEPGQYRFNPGLNSGTTDLYLPFELLGIGSPESTPLKLVAFAAEEGSLQLWAVLPQTNPVTSPFVTGLPRVEQGYVRFALNHPFSWNGLQSATCPNGSQDLLPNQRQYTDDYLQLSVTTDPAGASYRFLGDHLFGWWLTLFGDKPSEFSSMLGSISNEQGRVQDGQEINYTVHFENGGTEAAQDVMLQVRSRLALTLPDGTPEASVGHAYYQEIYIGDVAPGQSGTVIVRGLVNVAWADAAFQDCLAQFPTHPRACEFTRRWTLLSIQVFDQAHTESDGPRELLWVDHRVDSEPPAFAGIQKTAYGLSAVVNNTLRGYAFDESGIETVKLEIASPDGSTTQLDCNDPTPLDGQWNCGLNLDPAAQDGDIVRVRLQAKDAAGLEGSWSPWRTFVVDRTAADVTVGSVPTYTLGSAPVSIGSLNLGGQVQDNYGVHGVEICEGPRCDGALTQFSTREWSYLDTPATPVAIGDCSGGKLERAFTVLENQVVGEIRLGLQAEITSRDGLVVELTSPSGTTWQLIADDYDRSTNYDNLSVILSDRAVAGLSALRASQALTAGEFAALVRPHQPLAIFDGQAAVGTWTLSVCQDSSAGDQALYHGAQLWVEPPNTAPLAGSWQTTLRMQKLDDVYKTVLVYGMDEVGNRSPVPQALTFRIDNVTPVMTVTQVIPQLVMQPDLAAQTVLAGIVSDGGKVVRMHAYVRDPEGIGYSQRPVVNDDFTWLLQLTPMKVGTYRVWIAAEDEAGNMTTVGPFTVDVAAIPDNPMNFFAPVLTATITATLTLTPSVTITPTATITPTLTPMPQPTGTPTPVPLPTGTPTPPPIWTVMPTPTPTSTITTTLGLTPTVTTMPLFALVSTWINVPTPIPTRIGSWFR